uniref:Uncharacterized protein n=1 Tax=Rhizophagus irregularis (strain DAOM 181602 / DAOM 197198 / MUCL 43194) TaxID=747089 RepID=U9TK81_RHIID
MLVIVTDRCVDFLGSFFKSDDVGGVDCGWNVNSERTSRSCGSSYEEVQPLDAIIPAHVRGYCGKLLKELENNEGTFHGMYHLVKFCIRLYFLWGIGTLVVINFTVTEELQIVCPKRRNMSSMDLSLKFCIFGLGQLVPGTFRCKCVSRWL